MAALPAIQIPILQTILEHARQNTCWIVVVVDDGAEGLELLYLLHALVSNEASHAGRTVLLPDGGRVTVASLSSGVDATGFHLVFLTDSNSVFNDIHGAEWQSKAASVLRVGEHARDLVTT